MNGWMDGRMEFLSILWEFVPCWGCCPKADTVKEEQSLEVSSDKSGSAKPIWWKNLPEFGESGEAVMRVLREDVKQTNQWSKQRAWSAKPTLEIWK